MGAYLSFIQCRSPNMVYDPRLLYLVAYLTSELAIQNSKSNSFEMNWPQIDKGQVFILDG